MKKQHASINTEMTLVVKSLKRMKIAVIGSFGSWGFVVCPWECPAKGRIIPSLICPLTCQAIPYLKVNNYIERRQETQTDTIICTLQRNIFKVSLFLVQQRTKSQKSNAVTCSKNDFQPSLDIATTEKNLTFTCSPSM